MELLEIYDLEIQYHPRKANVVADALNRMTQYGLNIMISMQPDVLRDLENMAFNLCYQGSQMGSWQH